MRSHHWMTQERMPPVAPGMFVRKSASDAALQPIVPHKRRHGRHYACDVSSSGLTTQQQSVFAPNGGGAHHPGHSSSAMPSVPTLFEVELRLRELLMTTPAWPPSRKRTLATLDALVDLGRMSSSFSALLPLITSELKAAIVANPHGGEEPGDFAPHLHPGAAAAESSSFVPPVPTFFEVCDALRDEIRLLKVAAEDQSALIAEQKEELAGRDELIQGVQRELAACQQVVKAREGSIEAQAAKLVDAEEEKNLFAEEREEFQQMLDEEKQKLLNLQESGKGDRVALFVEQRKVIEQTALFREHRQQTKVAATAAANEVRTLQRLLLRAQHAHLRAEGLGQESFDLTELSVDEQLKQLLKWAEDLPEVKSEAELAPLTVAQFEGQQRAEEESAQQENQSQKAKTARARRATLTRAATTVMQHPSIADGPIEG